MNSMANSQIDIKRLSFPNADAQLLLGLKGDKGDTGDKGDKGDTGDTGNGIASITHTGTSGAVKTYTITFTDGTSQTYDVTDGQVTTEQMDTAIDNAVTNVKSDLNDEALDLSEVYQKHNTQTAATGHDVFYFPIVDGKSYLIKNTGVVGCAVNTSSKRSYNSNYRVEAVTDWLAAGNSLTWTASANANYVEFYFIGAGKGSIELIGGKVNAIESDISDIKDDITSINEKIISGYDKETQSLEQTDGSYFSAWDGSVGSYEDATRTDKISVNVGDVFFISGTYYNAIALISAFNSNNAFVSASSVFDTSATVHDVVDYKYVVPQGITKIGFSSFTDNGRALIVKKGIPIYAGDASEEMYSVFTSKIGSGYWKDKKIVWFGTSIPEGGYPQIVGELLGATVFNEAVGTSRVHFKYPITPTAENPYCFGSGFKAAARTLTNTLEEQEWIIDNWDSNFWTADKPDAMTEELANQIRSYSYENKVDKYLTAETFPDLFIFDHGHNDTTGTLEIQNQYYAQYGDYNLYTFRGAMNFLIQHILEYNPKARIVMIGEYCGTDADFVPNMQLQVARDWNIPICKNWERLGWTKTKQITANAHWVKRGSYYYWEADTEPHTMTVFDSWVPDGVHPIFDGSGRANNFMATSIAKWLNEEVNLL
jgi:hypothetical protein